MFCISYDYNSVVYSMDRKHGLIKDDLGKDNQLDVLGTPWCDAIKLCKKNGFERIFCISTSTTIPLEACTLEYDKTRVALQVDATGLVCQTKVG